MDKLKNTKIIFMGTPVFAAEILETLIANDLNIIGVVSQPNRKVGRKQEVKLTPVKEVADKYNIPTHQPEKVRDDLSWFEELKPDLIITAAFGQIIPQQLLDLPPLGCINVHGSLLPKYRGGAPIHYSIINGDDKTGVTIMEMVAKMDAGDMISQADFKIEINDTLNVVHDNMVEVAKNLLIKTLPDIVNQTYVAIPQNEDDVTYSPNISKEKERIDWNDDMSSIYNLIRGLNPFPGAYSTINDKRFKFYESKKIFADDDAFKKTENGKIINIDKEGILIGGDNCNILVKEFQLEGKKRTKIKDFINGNNSISIGDQFI